MESFGVPVSDCLGSLGVLLAAVGCLGGPLGVPAGLWDVPGLLGRDVRDFPGNFRRHLGLIMASVLVLFRDCCVAMFWIDF